MSVRRVHVCALGTVLKTETIETPFCFKYMSVRNVHVYVCALGTVLKTEAIKLHFALSSTT